MIHQDILDQKQFRIADIHRFPLGNQTELIYSKDCHTSKVLPSQDVDCLVRCVTFRTLDEHAHAISLELNLNQERMESLKLLLMSFVNSGFLVSGNDLVERCRNSFEGQSSQIHISSICFPTRNRVKGLKRALESFIENSQKHGRMNDFVVADDSEDIQVRREYKEMLQSLKNRYGVKTFYAGFEEKKRFAELLINRGLPADVVNFTLFDVEDIGHSTGANRNALLLHSAGDAIIMTDDDVICQMTQAPGAGKTLVFSSGQDPTEFCFYPDSETMSRSVPFVTEDVLGIHETFLGKPLGLLISEFSSNSKVNFDLMSSTFLRNLHSNGGSVIATLTGVVGDVGFGNPTGYLSLRGASRQRLLRSETEYYSAISSRQVLRKASLPVIMDGMFCMTTSIGLDNQDLLPPFIPVMRNQDAVFGATLRKCFKNSYLAHLPWAFLHSPLEEKRSFSAEDIWNSPVEWGMDNAFIHFIRNFQLPFSTEGKENLKALGKYLIQLGSLDQVDFKEMICLLIWRMKMASLERLEGLFKEYGENPEFWAKDLKKRLEKIRSSFSNDSDFRLVLKHELESEEMQRLKQRLILKFGQLLFWWPEIVETVKVLRNQSERLARFI